MNIWVMIQIVRQIKPPPDLEDEPAFRKWFHHLAAKATLIADKVSDESVKRTAEILRSIATDDELWARCYSVLRDADKYVLATDRIAATMVSVDATEGEETGTVLAEVMNLIETFRDPAPM